MTTGRAIYPFNKPHPPSFPPSILNFYSLLIAQPIHDRSWHVRLLFFLLSPSINFQRLRLANHVVLPHAPRSHRPRVRLGDIQGYICGPITSQNPLLSIQNLSLSSSLPIQIFFLKKRALQLLLPIPSLLLQISVSFFS